MKTLELLALGLGLSVLIWHSVSYKSKTADQHLGAGMTLCYTPQGCVFKTIFGEETSDNYLVFKTLGNKEQSIQEGLSWLVTAQLNSGGWGAGSHSRQDVLDSHAVNADPATTAMVGMAFLRSGSTLQNGQYAGQVQSALDYLLRVVESTPTNSARITTETGTQIQTKLGQNIDAILALQFFTNIVEYLHHDPALKNRVMKAMNVCISKVEALQEQDGSMAGSGWAGVLQSSLANSALEAAQFLGGDVDDKALDRSREYQKGNYDPGSGNVKTDRGAGVVLYSISGSVRATAKEARKAKEEVNRAKREGRIDENAPVSPEVLQEIGFDQEEAERYAGAYAVYESSKGVAQEDRVMSGFGSNGGEEFLSYLQTGESMIINKDPEWIQWYENISGRLVSIQNSDGSWSGHHCITSPVFCTATTLLTLSIHNDTERLTRLGQGEE